MSLELEPNIILLLFWGLVQLWRDCAIRHRCMSCQLGKPSCHRNMTDIDMLWFLQFSTWVLYGFWMILDDVHMQFPRHLQNNSSFTDAFLISCRSDNTAPNAIPLWSPETQKICWRSEANRLSIDEIWGIHRAKKCLVWSNFFPEILGLAEHDPLTFEALLQDVSWIAPIPAMFHQAPWWMLQFLDFVALASHQRCVQWNLETRPSVWGRTGEDPGGRLQGKATLQPMALRRGLRENHRSTAFYSMAFGL